jgi:hypothetical protein
MSFKKRKASGNSEKASAEKTITLISGKNRVTRHLLYIAAVKTVPAIHDAGPQRLKIVKKACWAHVHNRPR